MSLYAAEDRFSIISGIDWDTYVKIDELFGERRFRMKFCDNQLEIMSPVSRRHEYIKSNLGRMIELYCRRQKIFVQGEGGATLKKEPARGGEPDESYIFTRGREMPDLVIEAALTSGGIDKLAFYLPLEIPEVWIWQDDRLRLFHLAEGEYRAAQQSRFLPGLDIRLVERLADQPFTSDVLDAFERALDQG